MYYLHINIIRVLFLVLFLSSNILALSFSKLLDIDNTEFSYEIDDDTYKVFSNKQGLIKYNKSDGFSFFLPYFLKEYEIQILRFNSIGHISGTLSLHQQNSKDSILYVDKTDLKYFVTDYADKQNRQLSYLLDNKAIYYNKVKSLFIEGHNIPLSISKNLNKWFYFKYDKKTHNELQYIVYSYSFTFDKKLIDEYVKKHFKSLTSYKEGKFDNIHTFITHLNSIDKFKRLEYLERVNKRKKTQKKKKKTIKVKPKVEKLNIKRLMYMRKYGYTTVNDDSHAKEQLLAQSKKLNKLRILLDDFEIELLKVSPPKRITDAILDYKEYAKQITSLKESFQNIQETIPKDILSENRPLCKDYQILKDECLSNKIYLQNFITYSLQKNDPIDEEILTGYGTAQIFNDYGVDLYEKGDLEKSEIYLSRAYVLASKDIKQTISNNLGTLYLAKNTKKNNVKAIKYLKEANTVQSFYNLGILYYLGLGTAENDKKAFDCFKKASEQGLNVATKNFLILKKQFPSWK